MTASRPRTLAAIATAAVAPATTGRQRRAWRAGTLALCAWLLLAAAPAAAEQKQVFGDYEVHYIVLPTALIDAAVARASGIERAAERALVNVSVLSAGSPRAVRIAGTATDLLGRTQTLPFREVREPGGAIYYFATLRVVDGERWRFDIGIEPLDATAGFRLRFDQDVHAGAR
jgi:hypothetical protein